MNENNVINEVTNKQPHLSENFIKVIARNELSHSYLFNGESGVGKLALALFITMGIFCPNRKNGYPCGQCNECRRITEQQHPDVVIIKPDGQSIKVDQVRYLKDEFSKSGLEGNKKVFIIQDAEKMTSGAANSLLKFIEEPGNNIFSFLLTTNMNLILPTIISRTQVIELQHLDTDSFEDKLSKMGILKSQLHLVNKLTNSTEMVKVWQEDDWLSKMQNSVGNWFDLIVNNDAEAFVTIQSNFMPLVIDKDHRAPVINMMIAIFEDVLNYKYLKLGQFSFPNNEKNIELLANKISSKTLVQILEIILGCNKQISINVSFQNILESITLKIMNILNQ
ncbi:DNA polymerase III subunit delta' [Apilactobacillus micheneri]|uniref:DNA polymerase III subunit delta n=1 Tax=Apilactobacillus micheneri TaxID=1899430 RepID=A0A9Q8IM22_9LACO|nr:DNA polymerase III subunit delta' [Apilactobacillus micheneri]TPR39267.1 DNA polymerase III subunit delta' [Apilactobacillus micheneri]TPR41383.1 DNA polymerase III subunit delta' [Apilactobacillus micheneri]TPR43241.1 DNA polymerase III subunit delta' [Apilactobacillus micheneri]TPR44025.1 DNA polymerase III subunit delta' [Apilactobacillus micheneri]TPR44489.1 DNA polymerase III subunit delta' [Apilactobacillus micheneri]